MKPYKQLCQALYPELRCYRSSPDEMGRVQYEVGISAAITGRWHSSCYGWAPNIAWKRAYPEVLKAYWRRTLESL